MNSSSNQVDTHVVGGIELHRPFQIRRLGHFGINVESVEVAYDFYGRLLGFEISDEIDFGPRVPESLKGQTGGTKGLFTRCGTDHHAFVLFPKRTMHATNPHYAKYPELTVNQITWQVSTLQEVVDSFDWFKARGWSVIRSGRDTPGSNWHIYPADPAGHINELYYGIEQIGWAGISKPLSMHSIRYVQPPELPHRSEYAEVNQGLNQGLGLVGGYRRQDAWPETFDVGGVLLARPFKISKVGPVRIFVDDLDAAVAFYTTAMGLSLTEEILCHGHRCVFLRANTEHHSLALYPKALRAKLGLPARSSLLGFGVQLGSYQQLTNAITYLKSQGVQFVQLPQELSLGVGHHVWALDPDGNHVQLYWEMEQLGWEGRPKPAELRRTWNSDPQTWPAQLSPLSDSFLGEVFLGPLN
ncbi:MAG: extradiol dioxygenase [Betaproteobacteria bacterium]|nr:extradiol dioxygenase [Betaproteobacteria bacterium]NDD11944.1 extradiol dioxygenase [Betaproteobacteria bacterium]